MKRYLVPGAALLVLAIAFLSVWLRPSGQPDAASGQAQAGSVVPVPVPMPVPPPADPLRLSPADTSPRPPTTDAVFGEFLSWAE